MAGIRYVEEKLGYFCRAVDEEYMSSNSSRQVQEQIMEDLSAILASKTAEEWP